MDLSRPGTSLGALTLWLLLCSVTFGQPIAHDYEYPKPVRLTFSGKIDGSELIEISATHAHWTHRHWNWPSEPVYLNDVVWNPQKDRSLDNAGKTRYLSQPVVFRTARLENVKARDTVALETREDHVRILISDSPNGADTYEFDVVFERPASAQLLRIRAEIDGSDKLIIDKTGARWEHRHWKWPTRVVVGRTEWNPRKNPKLKYRDLSLYGPVDFSSAQLSVDEARDLVSLEHTRDGIIIHFADSPPGRANYTVTISFGRTEPGPLTSGTTNEE